MFIDSKCPNQFCGELILTEYDSEISLESNRNGDRFLDTISAACHKCGCKFDMSLEVRVKKTEPGTLDSEILKAVFESDAIPWTMRELSEKTSFPYLRTEKALEQLLTAGTLRVVQKRTPKQFRFYNVSIDDRESEILDILKGCISRQDSLATMMLQCGLPESVTIRYVKMACQKYGKIPPDFARRKISEM